MIGLDDACFACGRIYDHRPGCMFRIPEAAELRHTLDLVYGLTPPEPNKDERRRRAKKTPRPRGT